MHRESKILKISEKDRQIIIDFTEVANVTVVFLSLDLMIIDFNGLAEKLYGWDNQILNTSYTQWCEQQQVAPLISLKDTDLILKGCPKLNVESLVGHKRLTWSIIGSVDEKNNPNGLIFIGKEISDTVNQNKCETLANDLFKQKSFQTIIEDKNQILVVEDQAVAAGVVKNMLTILGYEVSIATTGSKAVELAKQNHYDLILMDIGLPDIDGFEVTKRIRLYEDDAMHKIPIVALTAHVDVENKKSCLSAGMNAVLTKPLLKEQAAQILSVFIPKHSTLHQTVDSTNIKDPLNNKEEMINFEKAKQVLGSEAILKKVLNMLVDNFAEENIKLEEAYSKQDWNSIQEIAHKFTGSAGYCGANRLKDTCSMLRTYIAENNLELMNSFYHQMRHEMNALTEYIMHNGLKE